MCWHRDSIGILIQRLLFTILILTSLVIFSRCDLDHELQECLKVTSIPLAISIVVLVLKVSLSLDWLVVLTAIFVNS